MGHIFFQNTVSTFVLSGGSAAHFPENQLVQGTKGGVQPQKIHFTSNFNFGNGFCFRFFSFFFPFFSFYLGFFILFPFFVTFYLIRLH